LENSDRQKEPDKAIGPLDQWPIGKSGIQHHACYGSEELRGKQALSALARCKGIYQPLYISTTTLKCGAPQY